MSELDCLYCGKKIPDNAAKCPHCGAISHFQKKGFSVGARKKFITLFVILVLIVFFFMLWLPQI